MTPSGIATVARQEFTLRIRAGRWRWLLIAWFLILLAFTVLLRLSLGQIDTGDTPNKGIVVYGGLALLVLALALLVVPALAAQSVNGDRERGTLATLQVTRLSAGDIAVGKLAAAWGTALVFVALSLPLVAYAMTLDGVPLVRVLVVTTVIALLLGSVIAVALCLSALLSRTTTSGVLAYLAVFSLTVGTLISFGLGTALTTEEVTVRSPAFCPSAVEPVPPPGQPEPFPSQTVPGQPEPFPSETVPCQPEQTYQSTRSRTDRVWWLLAPNPFVILADAAPQLPPETPQERRRRAELAEQGRSTTDLRDADPLGGIGRSVRELRNPPTSSEAGTGGGPGFGPEPRPEPEPERRPVWPYGLAFNVLLGAGAVWLTARQLRTPSRHLPKGQRVA